MIDWPIKNIVSFFLKHTKDSIETTDTSWTRVRTKNTNLSCQYMVGN